VAKWVRMSPRKARLVAEHIRGRSVPEARTVLAFTPRAAAREIEKVLRSAVANAEANHNLVGDDLIVSAAYVDEGPVMKRWRARARGRAARIRKPTCHITLKLTEPEVETRPEPSQPALPAEEEKPSRARRSGATRKPKAETAKEPEAPPTEETEEANA
jgi:large subunit ribosomal protein L22